MKSALHGPLVEGFGSQNFKATVYLASSHHEASKSSFSVRETGYTSAFAGYQQGLYHLLFSNSIVGSFTLALS